MTYITAHSGSDGTKENSIEFATYFKNKPIDILEIDVRKNNKNQLVLNHDELEENKEYVTLEDFFTELDKTNVKINCDLKDKNLEEDVYQLAQNSHIWDKVYFSGNISISFLKKWPNKVFMNIENVFDDSVTLDNLTEDILIVSLKKMSEYGAKYVNVYYQFVTENFEKTAQMLDMKISVWTVNDIEEISFFEDKKVFNITSRKALEYVNQRRSEK